MASQNFAPLRAAVVDGRAQNVYYKLTQLEKLHKSIVKNASALQEAIVADTGNTSDEARIEYIFALNALGTQWSELDPKKELEEEYAIANKQNASESRIGAGSVVIQPATYNQVYSVIAPLAAAIAAGNCVVIQLENNLRQVSTILRTILKEALDPDAFIVSQDTVRDAKILDSSVLVIQDGSLDNTSKVNQIISAPTYKTVAVVDRTADFDEAAKALITARFAFRGKSPYAPDVILVNEFVKKDLLQALVRQTIAAGDRDDLVNGALEKAKSRESGLKQLIAELQGSDDVRIVTQEATGAIIDIPKRNPNLLSRKVQEPCLLIHTIRSLDDAIDFLTSSSPTPLLAAYHFGTPEAGKYLSQFIPAQVSFVNHIPFEILVGPAFPLHHPISDPSKRYTRSQFSKPAPAFIVPSERSIALVKAAALSGAKASERAAALQKLYAAATADLPVLRKRPGETTVAFGFFEHSFVLHFSLLVLSTISVTAGGIWWLRSGRYR